MDADGTDGIALRGRVLCAVNRVLSAPPSVASVESERFSWFRRVRVVFKREGPLSFKVEWAYEEHGSG